MDADEGDGDGNKVEKVLEKLRNEMQQMSVHMYEAKKDTVRKSVSIMESRVERHNAAYESHLKEVASRHKEASKAQDRRHEEVVASLKEVISEKADNIAHLKGRLDEARTAKQEALQELAATRKGYSAKIKELETCITELRQKLVLLQTERNRFNSDCSKMQELESTIASSKEKSETLEKRVADLQVEIKEKEELVERLEAANSRLELSFEAVQTEVKSLSDKLAESIKKNSTAATEDSVRVLLEEQITNFRAELDDTKKKLVLEQVSSEKIKDENIELRKQVGMLKVDLRIEGRHKRELEAKVQESETKYGTLSNNYKLSEEDKVTLQSKLALLHDENESLKGLMEAKMKELDIFNQIQAQMKDKVTQLEEEVAFLLTEINVLRYKAQQCETLQAIRSQNLEALSEKAAELEQKDREIEKLNGNYASLKETISVLDEQLQQFLEDIEQKAEALISMKDQNNILVEENKETRDKLTSARIELNEARSLKAFTEKKLQATESTLKNKSETTDSEVQQALERLSLACKRNEELSAQVSALMVDVSALEKEKFDYRRQVEENKAESEKLTKELRSLLNAVVDTKDENGKLKEAFAETLTKAEKYKGLLQVSEETCQRLKHDQATVEFTLTTRVEQQDKLIDYLRGQLVVYQEKKKKKSIFTPKRTEAKDEPSSGTPKLYPLMKKGWGVPQQAPSRPLITPMCLEEEKLAVQKLEEKRENLRCQLEHLQNFSSPVTRKAPTLPTTKKEDCVLLKERSNTIGVGYSKPGPDKSHKILDGRCESTKKCRVCNEPIYKGRPMSKCLKCNYVFHIGCTGTAGNTCGATERSTDESEGNVIPRHIGRLSDEIDDTDVKGWVSVKTGKMQGAEKRYLVIEGDVLNLYTTDRTTDRPIDWFMLNEKTTVFFSIGRDFARPLSKDELAFAMKVNFYDEGYCTSIYMFHSNKKQKRYWTRALQAFSNVRRYVSSTENTLVSDQSFSSQENKENESIKLIGKDLFLDDHRNNLYVNCVFTVPNSQTYLLGCDDGLYSLKKDKQLVKIKGPKSIYQIDVLKAGKMAVFIEGPDRVLSTVYFELMKSCAEAAECSEPKFTTEVVADTKDCYVFARRSNSLKDTIVAVANSNSLLLCTLSGNGLTVIKQIVVKDSITTLLMTPQTVLFGNHSVFEVDTNSFQVEEFLDTTEDSIYILKLINESHGSYPVAILDVTRSRGRGIHKRDPEYLICFQDIGIFVDGFGRRSREGDILWSRVPISFEYRHPYLFIFHFSSVEIQELDEKSYTKIVSGRDKSTGSVDKRQPSGSSFTIPEIKIFPVNSKCAPNYVGKGKDGVVITLCEAEGTKLVELCTS